MKWFALALVAALALAGCQLAQVPVTGITLSLSAQTLPPGTQYTLGASVSPANATDRAVTWTSSAPGVATVTEGLVQAIAPGAATIIVTTHDGGYTATCSVTVASQVIPPPVGLTGPVKAALYDGTTVRLWDGTNTVDWKTGVAKHGNGKKITVGPVLYFLDAAGAITRSINLPALPAGVTVIGDPVVYTFENITNADAMALDWTPPALGGNYTRIWQDGVEVGDWHANGWTYVSSFEAANGDLIAVDNIFPGRIHDISRPLIEANGAFTRVIWAVPDGPLFFMPDSGHPNDIVVYDAAHPGGQPVTMIGAMGRPGNNPWMEFPAGSGEWYSGYGVKWDGSTLTAGATAMGAFSNRPSSQWEAAHGYIFPQNSDAPVMLPAYADASALYFVECNTGTLWSYTPQTNVVALVDALYAGDGKNGTGFSKQATLAPQVIADGSGKTALYFHDAGTLWSMNTTSTVISAFSADQQMWVMK
jgi:hypothetical protein